MFQLLIDGHNLIGQMPGASLADFDDEEKLVAQLRRYAARRTAHIVVVFDSGNVAGRSRELSGGGVEAVFAGSHTNADRILIERIRAAEQPGNWTLVSSDHAIQDEAKRRRMPVVESAAFAQRMSPGATAHGRRASEAGEKPGTSGDVDEWLKLFKKK